MNLQPLLAASPVIQGHLAVAASAFVLGGVQLALPKGTLRHRITGLVWCLLMAAICLSSFFIHEIRSWGIWSPIHLLSIFTLIVLVRAINQARTGRIGAHRRSMVLLYVLALVVTGAFTFYPDRLMYQVVAGH